MQVKKFEAKTMKEALEIVKAQLGPDAIILAAKDNSRGFGLGGQSSVEITAAVSEEMLKKKQFVESKVRNKDLDRLKKAPAKIQKSFIDNMINNYVNEKGPRRELTKTQYIDIVDDEPEHLEPEPQISLGESATERIKSAAQRAWNAMQAGIPIAEPTRKTVASLPAGASESTMTSNIIPSSSAPVEELMTLRSEVASLKNVLAEFQRVPQSIVGKHPGSEYGLAYEFAGIFEKLVQAGIADEIAAEILTKAQEQMPAIKYKNKALIEGWVAKYILETTKVVEDLQSTQLQFFVGPAGSGKTSSLVKLAAHYVVNAHKKVALLTSDTKKVGATDQLRIYAQILNVPFAVVRNKGDWGYILTQLRGYDYVLCDCHASNMKTLEDIQQMKEILPPTTQKSTTHLVLNATSKDADLTEIGRRYRSTGFQDVIFTTLDNSGQHGNIYNFMKRFEVPLHSFGIGPRVPEDFETATRERVLDLIFKLSKVKKD